MAGLVAFAPTSGAVGGDLTAYAYATGNDLCIFGVDVPGQSQEFANRFVASTNGRLQSVTVATEDPTPTVSIWSDEGGAPGSLVSSSAGTAMTPSHLPPLAFGETRIPLWSEAWPDPPDYVATAWRTFALSQGETATALVKGVPYWISIKTTMNSQVELETCVPADADPVMAWRVDDSQWQPLAFDVDGYLFEFRLAVVGSIQLEASLQDVVATVDTEMTPTADFTTGWLNPSFTVSPQLPEGLSVNPSTGAISGAPIAAHEAADYIVTGTGTDHLPVGTATATAVITITVTDAPSPEPPAPPPPAPAPPLAPTEADAPAPTPPTAQQPTPQATPLPTTEPLVIPTPSDVRPSEMAAWTPAQVSTIDPADFAQLDPDVIGAISPEQAAAMSPEQISNIRPLGAAELQPATVSAMSPAQLAGLRPSAVGALSPLVICAPVEERCVLGENGLTAAQLAAFRPQSFADLQPEQFRVIRPAQVADLTTAAMNQIRSAGVAALQPRTLAALDPAQLAAMRRTAVGALTPEAITLLAPRQVRALRPDGIARLSISAVAQIHPTALAGMSNAQVTALTPAQVSSLTHRQLAALSPAQRRLLEHRPPT